jgi:hypothetical protein
MGEHEVRPHRTATQRNDVGANLVFARNARNARIATTSP